MTTETPTARADMVVEVIEGADVWLNTITGAIFIKSVGDPAMSGAPTPTLHAETETLIARLERLNADYDAAPMDHTRDQLANALMYAYRSGQLIALDVPANGDVPLPHPDHLWAWCFNDAKHGGWDKWGGYARQTNRFPLDERERLTGAEYISVVAHKSALRAERVAGMREAAGIADGLLMQSKYPTKFLFKLPVYAEDVSIAIRAAADKLEAGE